RWPPYLYDTPEVVMERRMEWRAGESSEARWRRRTRRRVGQPGLQSHARIAIAEYPDWYLARERLPAESRLGRRLRQSRYRFHKAPWSVSRTPRKPPRWNPA